MAHAQVRKMVLAEAEVTRFEPTRVEHVTATSSDLQDLGSVFMTFDADGRTEPWTLRYEEVIYVVSGHLALTVQNHGRDDAVVTGGAGDVFTLPRGATVRYGGTAGTRLFVSLVPITWRQLDH